MRRPLCAAVMVTCAALLGSAVRTAAQETGSEFQASQATAAYRSAAGMASDGSFVVTWSDAWPAPTRNIWGRRFDAAAQPAGPAFRVNSDTTSTTKSPAVAVQPGGAFTVVWSGVGSAGWQVRGQRFDASGAPLGAEFAANTFTSGVQADPALASDAAGNTVIVWTRSFIGFGQPVPSNGARIHGRRFDASGAPQGGEFRVNTYTGGLQLIPAIAFQSGGGFVVTWHGTDQDGSAEGVFAQRYDASGAAVGGEFPVNTFTSGIQAFPSISPAGNGGFVIAWVSSEAADDAGPGVFARQYDAGGSPLGPEFRVASTPLRFAQRACSVVADARGGYAIEWTGGFLEAFIRRYDGTGVAIGPPLTARSQGAILTQSALAGDGSGRLVLTWAQLGDPRQVRGQRFGTLWPVSLAVDESPGASDRNGVLDPGEAAVVAPTWHNAGAADALFAGQAASFTGPGAPGNPLYLTLDALAEYGTLAAGTARSCGELADCYTLGLSTPVPRPQRHMDATFLEQLSNQQLKTWRVHIGGSFDDIARTDPFYRFVETLLHHGVSSGCGGSSFCPAAAATREQMAVFLLVAKLSAGYRPPRPATGIFVDVPTTSPFAPWIEDLWNREVVTGCGNGAFCPTAPVTRAQMAVMLLRAVEGPAYVPPACTTPVFADVPCADPFARWVNELSVRGITSGCGGGLYCPGSPVTRAQMAVFLMRGFALELYGAGDAR